MGRRHRGHTASPRLQSHRHSWQKQCRHELEHAVLMSRHSGHAGFSWLVSRGAAGAAWLVWAAEVPGSGVSSLDDIWPCKRHKVCPQEPLPKNPTAPCPSGAVPHLSGGAVVGLEQRCLRPTGLTTALCPVSCSCEVTHGPGLL